MDIFRGLKFEPDKEIGKKSHFRDRHYFRR